MASEGYAKKASCLNGVESVRKNSQDPKRFEKKTTASGKYTFRLCSTNGQCIGTSQTYSSESGCRNGMKSVAKNAPGAAIVDQTA